MYLNTLFITPVRAGELLGYKPQTTRNMICLGTFPLPIVIIGKRKMVRISDLEKYVEELPVVPSSFKKRKRGAPTKAARLSAIQQSLEGAKQ